MLFELDGIGSVSIVTHAVSFFILIAEIYLIIFYGEPASELPKESGGCSRGAKSPNPIVESETREKYNESISVQSNLQLFSILQ